MKKWILFSILPDNLQNVFILLETCGLMGITKVYSIRRPLYLKIFFFYLWIYFIYLISNIPRTYINLPLPTCQEGKDECSKINVRTAMHFKLKNRASNYLSTPCMSLTTACWWSLNNSGQFWPGSRVQYSAKDHFWEKQGQIY